ncbi:TetR/AcrR family transcriptional regulator [Jannaschia sp. CCS1]|uniref:TetR/AcrR family transcriptional regulator n=1 Tax=Jannaschia sp. (strain CCS1) TaxID=290400 RepID=UPI000053BEC2|nr:TetR/AcrR family transcriptional regulator [Jannaschia sp. CCS1]ABD54216.1 transcriptional regulator, TetR family [Jannaschia sp. CCS1]
MAVNTYCMEPQKSEPNGQASKSGTDRLGPEAWIDAAYVRFRKGGVSAVRVDPIAKGLGITRGSFYWHFKDRAALLHAILKRWREEETERTIAENEAAGGDASTRLLRLLHTCSADDGRLEIGMRDWAAQDEDAHKEVRLIDTRRIQYMATLAREAGIRSNAAEARCRVAYLAWLGSYVDATVTSREELRAHMNTLWQMVMAK